MNYFFIDEEFKQIDFDLNYLSDLQAKINFLPLLIFDLNVLIDIKNMQNGTSKSVELDSYLKNLLSFMKNNGVGYFIELALIEYTLDVKNFNFNFSETENELKTFDSEFTATLNLLEIPNFDNYYSRVISLLREFYPDALAFYICCLKIMKISKKFTKIKNSRKISDRNDVMGKINDFILWYEKLKIPKLDIVLFFAITVFNVSGLSDKIINVLDTSNPIKQAKRAAFDIFYIYLLYKLSFKDGFTRENMRFFLLTGDTGIFSILKIFNLQHIINPNSISQSDLTINFNKIGFDNKKHIKIIEDLLNKVSESSKQIDISESIINMWLHEKNHLEKILTENF